MVDFAKALADLKSAPGYVTPEKPKVFASGPIKLFRKHRSTGEVTQSEGTYTIGLYEPISGPPWTSFRLEGGPTGYESFVLVDDKGPHISTINSVLNSPYWSACAGTTDRWDECRVHRNEMRRVLIPWIEAAGFEGACTFCGSSQGVLAEDPLLLKRADRFEMNFTCCDCHGVKDKAAHASV